MGKQMRDYIAETIGTFFLVLMGCGAIIVNDLYGNMLGHAGVSASFGIIVMAMIYSIGNISGAHINPAVSFGFFLVKKISANKLIGYVVSQFVGAILAALLLKLLFPEHQNLGATLPNMSIVRVFVLEVVLSALLMFVILNVSTGHKETGIMAGVAIGGIIMLEALVAGSLTGASMNPARSFAPAIVSLNLQHIWIYLTAPLVGVAIVSPSCRLLQGDECCVPENKTACNVD